MVLVLSGCGTVSPVTRQTKPINNSNSQLESTQTTIPQPIVTATLEPLRNLEAQITEAQYYLGELVYASAYYIGMEPEENFNGARNFLINRFGIDLINYDNQNTLYNALLEHKDGSREDAGFIFAYQIERGVNSGSYNKEYFQEQLRKIGY